MLLKWTTYSPNHPWYIISCKNPRIKGIEARGNTDGMRIILAKIDSNLRVVIHHNASNILSIRSAVHLQEERCRVVTVCSVRRWLTYFEQYSQWLSSIQSSKTIDFRVVEVIIA